MTTSFCSGCGSEYQPGVEVCPECGVLVATEGTLLYEMDGWEPGERTTLGDLLRAEGVPHRWEGDHLVVPETQEDGVDAVMDRVEFPDALEATEVHEDDEELDDEAVYAVMSDLFVAADRLSRERVVDVDLAGELVTASAAASAAPPPYGVEGRVWAQVQQLAEGIVAALEGEADDDVVVRDGATLRDLLRNYV